MADTPSRLFGLLCVLIGVWALVYWLYEPRPPRVTADSAPAMTSPRPAEPTVQLPPPPVPAPTPQPEPVPDPAPPAPTPTPQPERPAVIEPRFREYVVVQGDVSFEAIAQRVWGDRKKWDRIARANPLVSSDRLKPGRTVLKIPLDPDNIQGKPVDPPAATPAAPETTYVVQEGDTLWAIAKKVYGKGGLWKRIADANRDVLKDPDRPAAGTVLNIPAAE